MKSGQRAKLGEILERQSVKLQELTARCSKYARHFAKPLCESVKSGICFLRATINNLSAVALAKEDQPSTTV